MRYILNVIVMGMLCYSIACGSDSDMRIQDTVFQLGESQDSVLGKLQSRYSITPSDSNDSFNIMDGNNWLCQIKFEQGALSSITRGITFTYDDNCVMFGLALIQMLSEYEGKSAKISDAESAGPTLVEYSTNKPTEVTTRTVKLSFGKKIIEINYISMNDNKSVTVYETLSD